MRTRSSVVAVAGLLTLLLTGCHYLQVQRAGRATVSVAMKQPARPITSIAVVVSGPNMAPITRTLAITDDQVDLEVPAGPDRTFTVLVNTADVTFKGETTVDLAAGESTTVIVRPTLAATSILVPDPDDNQRLVQIDDMSGAGWAEIDYTAFASVGMSSSNNFQPYDVDFDDHGRIYVANRSDGIVRIDDMSAGDPLWFARGSVSAFQTRGIAVDRQRGWIYYTNGTQLNRLPVASPTDTPTPIDLSDIYVSTFNLYGLDTDSDGYLYLGYEESSVYRVLKIDPLVPPARARLVASYQDPAVFSGFIGYIDVVVKDLYVYVTNQAGGTGKRILKLTKGLVFVSGFGDPAPTLPALPQPGDFYGPQRFVAILNRKITVIDEGTSGMPDTDDERLVAFDDMTGVGWVTYGTRGFGTGEFGFFYFGE